MSNRFFINYNNGLDKDWNTNITGISQANPCVVTFASHPYSVGDSVRFSNSIGGMSQIRNLRATVTATTTTTITVDLDTSTGFSTFSSGGQCELWEKTIQSITATNPIVVTCNNHQFSDDDWISFNIDANHELDKKTYQVKNSTANTFEILIDGTENAVFTAGTLSAVLNTSDYYYDNSNVTNSNGLAKSGDEIYFVENDASVIHSLGDVEFTLGSNIVNTSADYTGVVSVGDYIGKPTAEVDGSHEMFYRIIAINVDSVTLGAYYGGLTETVSGIKSLNPQEVGSNGSIIVRALSGTTVTGGWRLVEHDNNGKTSYKHAFGASNSNNRGIRAHSNSIVDKINVFEHAESLLDQSSIYHNSTTIGHGGTCSVRNNGNNVTIENCAIGPAATGTQASLRVFSQPSFLVKDCFITGFRSTGRAAIDILSGATIDLSGTVVSGAGRGGTVAGTDCRVYNGTFQNCGLHGIRFSTNRNIVIDNCTFNNNLDAIHINGGGSNIILNCEFNLNDIAINEVNSGPTRAEGCLFNNNDRDIQASDNGKTFYSFNNTHISPITRSYNRLSNSGTFVIVNCSIDPASLLKAFLPSSLDTFVEPQFKIQNSFGITGQIYGKFELIRNEQTIPPSLQTKFSISTILNPLDFKIMSTFAKTGVNQTLSFKLRALTSGWVGTLIPRIKLNGKVIQTETNITTIDHLNDDEYTYNISGGLITEDGELSIEMNANANTVAVLIKDFIVS